jgi:DNA-binding NarL/FixJ family response regulator
MGASEEAASDEESHSGEPERSPELAGELPARIRVLCVDDDPATNRLHAIVLSEEPDIEVVGELLDPEGIFEAVEERRPDVVLLDLLMGKSTVETCALLRARYPRLRIIAMSGLDRAEMIETILGAGANGFVLKAFDFERIAPAIRRVARGEKLVLLDRGLRR